MKHEQESRLMERVMILCSTLPSQAASEIALEFRMKAYVMALQSCEDATLADLDAVMDDIICGRPAPLTFAPTSGKLAAMVRDAAARRRWESEQSKKLDVMQQPDVDPVISKKEAERRQGMLAKLSEQVKMVTHANKA